MALYLNWKGPQGRETVDEFGPEIGQSWREFRAYVRAMTAEYRLAGMDVYESSRACKDWKGSYSDEILRSTGARSRGPLGQLDG